MYYLPFVAFFLSFYPCYCLLVFLSFFLFFLSSGSLLYCLKSFYLCLFGFCCNYYQMQINCFYLVVLSSGVMYNRLPQTGQIKLL